MYISAAESTGEMRAHKIRPRPLDCAVELPLVTTRRNARLNSLSPGEACPIKSLRILRETRSSSFIPHGDASDSGLLFFLSFSHSFTLSLPFFSFTAEKFPDRPLLHAYRRRCRRYDRVSRCTGIRRARQSYVCKNLAVRKPLPEDLRRAESAIENSARRNTAREAVKNCDFSFYLCVTWRRSCLNAL